MTNKELKERLDSAETSSEKKGIIEFCAFLKSYD